MADYVWIGTTSSAFGTSTNWSPTGVPTTGDTITFDGRAIAALTGGNQSSITLTRITQFQSCSYDVGSIANPLLISATTVEIGVPPEDGTSGSGAEFHLVTGSNATSVTVYNSKSTGTSGKAPILIRGINASNKLQVRGGLVAIAEDAPGTSATFSEVTVVGSSAKVTIGSGVTLTTVYQSDGNILLKCAATTVTQTGGQLATKGSGAITTANVGGTAVLNATGTITNLNVNAGGSADFSQTTDARTVTNPKVYGSGKINADNGKTLSVTFTNAVQCLNGAKSSQINFGSVSVQQS